MTTVDAFHHRYIVRAMELGCDAITEKPMTIDAAKCRAIMDAVSRTGRKLTVAFNYRWRPGCTLVRRLLQEGTIGEIVHVDLSYLLDTSHGADYFRRWHREKDKSGGLLVHKGHSPLRPGQLVAGRGARDGVRDGPPRLLRPRERRAPRRGRPRTTATPARTPGTTRSP